MPFLSATAPAPEYSLVDSLLRTHHVMLRLLAVLLLVALGVVGYVLGVAQPALARYIDMAYSSRTAQVSLLEQSGAIRGWLATGDESFLAAYATARRTGDAGFDALVSEISRDGTDSLTDAVVDTAVTRAAWSTWADEVVASAQRSGTPSADRTAALLREGARLFERYRRANEVSTSLILELRADALAASRTAMILGVSVFAVALGTTALLTVRRRRRVATTLIEPMSSLLDTIDRLRRGDLAARVPGTGVVEVDRMGEALGALASSLDAAQEAAVVREARLAYLADQFETIVRVGREVAGSLSVRYVSQTVTSAAADLLAAPATLWVRAEDQRFHATARSEDPHGVDPPQDLMPPEPVAAAAADARPAGDDVVRAYPLVLAGTVVGVLETRRSAVDEDTDQVLQALLATAAAALESAHLHSAARELADLDALTRLPNRRRFEGDMQAEWDRCRRYGRPMCLVMIDLDHFKTLNDEHGHLFGDEVLRGAAEALVGALRTSDTAYRYGGEEFAVLLRETGLEDACEVAERIRIAISEAAVPRHGVLVTASAGVAERVISMAHHTELVASADAALYRAKREGRDQVATATP